MTDDILRQRLQICNQLEPQSNALLASYFGPPTQSRFRDKSVVEFRSALGSTARVFKRWRPAHRFNPQTFTVRSYHPNYRVVNELEQILKGAFEFYFYYKIHDLQMVDWFIINVSEIRLRYNENPRWWHENCEDVNQEDYSRYIEFPTSAFHVLRK
jgi:hypothetical protein